MNAHKEFADLVSGQSSVFRGALKTPYSPEEIVETAAMCDDIAVDVVDYNTRKRPRNLVSLCLFCNFFFFFPSFSLLSGRTRSASERVIRDMG